MWYTEEKTRADQDWDKLAVGQHIGMSLQSLRSERKCDETLSETSS